MVAVACGMLLLLSVACCVCLVSCDVAEWVGRALQLRCGVWLHLRVAGVLSLLGIVGCCSLVLCCVVAAECGACCCSLLAPGAILRSPSVLTP